MQHEKYALKNFRFVDFKAWKEGSRATVDNTQNL